MAALSIITANAMKDKVLRFINRFTNGGKNYGTIDTFKNGCCYWFAHILQERFYDPYDWPGAWSNDGEIMYDKVVNHFGCQIEGIVYDITGDVTDAYDWEPWVTVAQEDDVRFTRIVRDCIEF